MGKELAESAALCACRDATVAGTDGPDTGTGEMALLNLVVSQ